MALVLAGCSTEKAPPTAQWLAPSSPTSWAPNETVLLRFALADPLPTRGQTGPAQWNASIGPDVGVTWWSQSGTFTGHVAGLDGSIRDTVSVQWTVPPSPLGAESDLLLSIVVTDGEGQRGADFMTASIRSEPLTSNRFWSLSSSSPTEVSGFEPDAVTPSTVTQLDLPGAEHLVALDGEEKVVVGGHQQLTGHSTNETGVIPSELWVRAAPPTAGATPLRFLRRAPSVLTGSAMVNVGWADRVEWITASGSVFQTWLLAEGETLIDALFVADELIVLARTEQNEARLIRFGTSPSARLGSITWTPEAPSSMGPGGRLWLGQMPEGPTAFEADGTMRTAIGPTGNFTGLLTTEAPGSGDIQYAGQLEDGRPWIQRQEAHALTSSGTWVTAPSMLTTAEDRALDGVWVLRPEEMGTPSHWMALHRDDWSDTGWPQRLVSGNTRSGSIGHSRTGPQ